MPLNQRLLCPGAGWDNVRHRGPRDRALAHVTRRWRQRRRPAFDTGERRGLYASGARGWWRGGGGWRRRQRCTAAQARRALAQAILYHTCTIRCMRRYYSRISTHTRLPTIQYKYNTNTQYTCDTGQTRNNGGCALAQPRRKVAARTPLRPDWHSTRVRATQPTLGAFFPVQTAT